MFGQSASREILQKRREESLLRQKTKPTVDYAWIRHDTTHGRKCRGGGMSERPCGDPLTRWPLAPRIQPRRKHQGRRCRWLARINYNTAECRSVSSCASPSPAAGTAFSQPSLLSIDSSVRALIVRKQKLRLVYCGCCRKNCNDCRHYGGLSFRECTTLLSPGLLIQAEV